MELILTWVIKAEHTGVGGSGGGTWVIQVEHTGILTKNTILFGFYIFMHRHPAPSVPEHSLYTYCCVRWSEIVV